MRVSREAVSLALVNLLSNYQPLKSVIRTFTRSPRFWDQVPSGQKPMLMIFKGGPATETADQPQGQRIALTKWIINYNVWLIMESDPTGAIVAETVINAVGDGIEGAMQQSVISGGRSYGGPNERQTLGGLVLNAFISGGVEWAREFEDNNIVCMWRIEVEAGQ